jgi:hypothetical protein
MLRERPDTFDFAAWGAHPSVRAAIKLSGLIA